MENDNRLEDFAFLLAEYDDGRQQEEEHQDNDDVLGM